MNEAQHAVDKKRIVTGLLLAAVILAALWFRGIPLLLLIMLVSALALWEFLSLFWGKSGWIAGRVCAILLGWGMLVLTWMHGPLDALVCLGA
ncbi:MAG: phosphatidate cytidylyltransferase, partial [Desulfovibrio sp.]|nr:phosphatidate cytidylyltransferase [Desulfovibrio sp.]